MSELLGMIEETKLDLQAARERRNSTPGHRRFLEVDAVAAKIRLIALEDARRAFERDRPPS